MVVQGDKKSSTGLFAILKILEFPRIRLWGPNSTNQTDKISWNINVLVSLFRYDPVILWVAIQVYSGI